MNALVSAISDYFLFVILYPWRLSVELIEWAVEFVTESIVNVAYGLLPTGVADYIADTVQIREISSLVQTATWWIPVFGILAIYIQAYTLAATIRLVRWIIGLIPTIEG